MSVPADGHHDGRIGASKSPARLSPPEAAGYQWASLLAALPCPASSQHLHLGDGARTKAGSGKRSQCTNQHPSLDEAAQAAQAAQADCRANCCCDAWRANHAQIQPVKDAVVNQWQQRWLCRELRLTVLTGPCLTLRCGILAGWHYWTTWGAVSLTHITRLHIQICRSLAAQTTCMSFSLPQPPIRLTGRLLAAVAVVVPHLVLAPPNKDYIIASARFERELPRNVVSCPRPLRVLMTSCACHLTPVWGAKFLHPVLTASLQTNKMAHACRKDSVDTCLRRCADTRWPSGHHGSSSPRTRCRANTRLRTTPSLPLLPVHAASLAHPASRLIPMWSRCSPSYTTPPCFHPCSTAMGIVSSTCITSIRRHDGACQPRRGYHHLQVIRPRSGDTYR